MRVWEGIWDERGLSYGSRIHIRGLFGFQQVENKLVTSWDESQSAKTRRKAPKEELGAIVTGLLVVEASVPELFLSVQRIFDKDSLRLESLRVGSFFSNLECRLCNPAILKVQVRRWVEFNVVRFKIFKLCANHWFTTSNQWITSLIWGSKLISWRWSVRLCSNHDCCEEIRKRNSSWA